MFASVSPYQQSPFCPGRPENSVVSHGVASGWKCLCQCWKSKLGHLGKKALNSWANSPAPNFQFLCNNSCMSLKTIQVVCIIQWVVNTMNYKWKATTEFTLQKCQLAKFDDDIVEFLLGNNFMIVII